MEKEKFDNYYDVIYKTKSGHAMIAKHVAAKTAEQAKIKVKKQMRESSSFDSIIMAIKL